MGCVCIAQRPRSGAASAVAFIWLFGVPHRPRVPPLEKRQVLELGKLPGVSKQHAERASEARYSVASSGWFGGYMHTLTFANENGHRESLTVCGPRCVAEWHAAKLRRQRVTRFVIITPNARLDREEEAR